MEEDILRVKRRLRGPSEYFFSIGTQTDETKRDQASTTSNNIICTISSKSKVQVTKPKETAQEIIFVSKVEKHVNEIQTQVDFDEISTIEELDEEEEKNVPESDTATQTDPCPDTELIVPLKMPKTLPPKISPQSALSIIQVDPRNENYDTVVETLNVNAEDVKLFSKITADLQPNHSKSQNTKAKSCCGSGKSRKQEESIVKDVSETRPKTFVEDYLSEASQLAWSIVGKCLEFVGGKSDNSKVDPEIKIEKSLSKEVTEQTINELEQDADKPSIKNLLKTQVSSSLGSYPKVINDKE